MPIMMMTTEDGAGPVVVCDYCGKRIVDSDGVNCIWKDENCEPGSFSDMYIVHNQCDELMQRRHGVMSNSTELDILLPQLADNVNIDWEKARQRAKEVASFMTYDEDELQP